jgi:hypothetical protein
MSRERKGRDDVRVATLSPRAANVPVESFFGRLNELAPDRVVATRDPARAAMYEYLEMF